MRNIKKLLCCLLAVGMVLSLLPQMALAATEGFSDVPSDQWYADPINRWAGYGVLQGDGTGNFDPEGQMTRAEFASMLVKLMGYTKKAANTFSDVPADAWYADDILKLVEAGVMNGMGDGTANPNGPISREQAAVMLCRAMNIKARSSASVNSFSDGAYVSDWARDAVAALTERSMINGMGDGTFAPLDNINRASVASLVSQMVSEYVVDDGATVTGTQDKIVIIKADNVTIKDADLKQPVVIAPAAAGAKVSLTGNTTAADVVVAAEGATVEVDKSAKVTSVEVKAPNTSVEVSGTVASIEVAEDADRTVIETKAGAKVDNVTAAGDTTVSGASGTVGNVTATGSADVDVKAPGAKVDNQTTNGTVTAGGQEVKPGETVTEPSTPSQPSNPGGSQGGGSTGDDETEEPKCECGEDCTCEDECECEDCKCETCPGKDEGDTVTEEFTVIPAPLVDKGGEKELYTTYTVNGENKEVTIEGTSTDGGATFTVPVTVKATGLVKHTPTGDAGEGYWVGIGIGPIEDAVYGAGWTEEDAIDNLDEEGYDDTTKDGFVTFYFDPVTAEEDTGYVVVRYTGEDDETVTVTYVITFDVTLANEQVGGEGDCDCADDCTCGEDCTCNNCGCDDDTCSEPGPEGPPVVDDTPAWPRNNGGTDIRIAGQTITATLTQGEGHDTTTRKDAYTITISGKIEEKTTSDPATGTGTEAYWAGVTIPAFNGWTIKSGRINDGTNAERDIVLSKTDPELPNATLDMWFNLGTTDGTHTTPTQTLKLTYVPSGAATPEWTVTFTVKFSELTLGTSSNEGGCECTGCTCAEGDCTCDDDCDCTECPGGETETTAFPQEDYLDWDENGENEYIDALPASNGTQDSDENYGLNGITITGIEAGTSTADDATELTATITAEYDEDELKEASTVKVGGETYISGAANNGKWVGFKFAIPAGWTVTELKKNGSEITGFGDGEKPGGEEGYESITDWIYMFYQVPDDADNEDDDLTMEITFTSTATKNVLDPVKITFTIVLEAADDGEGGEGGDDETEFSYENYAKKGQIKGYNPDDVQVEVADVIKESSSDAGITETYTVKVTGSGVPYTKADGEVIVGDTTEITDNAGYWVGVQFPIPEDWEITAVEKSRQGLGIGGADSPESPYQSGEEEVFNIFFDLTVGVNQYLTLTFEPKAQAGTETTFAETSYKVKFIIDLTGVVVDENDTDRLAIPTLKDHGGANNAETDEDVGAINAFDAQENPSTIVLTKVTDKLTVYTVTLNGQVAKHKNANGLDGFWAGIAILQDTNNRYEAAAGHKDAMEATAFVDTNKTGTDVYKDGDDDSTKLYDSFYFNVSQDGDSLLENAGKAHVAVRVGTGENQRVIIYNINFNLTKYTDKEA